MGRIEHDRLGFNYRLTDLAAAIGVAQLERADEILSRRDRVAAMYRDRLGPIEDVILRARTVAPSAGAGSCTSCSFRREPTATP